MSKWILCADLQLDEHLSNSQMHPSGLPSRLVDMINCWKWIEATALKHKCAGIIVIGDIFDSRSSIELTVLHAVCSAFHDTHKKGLKIHIVAGNHDSHLRSPEFNSLQVFNGYATIHDRPGICTTPGQPFVFVPWHDDVQVYSDWVASVSKTFPKPYLFTHALLQGVASSNGVPVKALKAEAFKRVYLGDVHDPKIIHSEEMDTPIRYVGSPMQINYSDAGGTRGIVLLDVIANKETFIVNEVSPRFHVIEDVDINGIRTDDFVRVKTDDVQIATETLAAVRAITGNVTSTAVMVEDVKPRLDIRASQEHAEILETYCKHMDVYSPELVGIGLEILEEAKKGQ